MKLLAGVLTVVLAQQAAAAESADEAARYTPAEAKALFAEGNDAYSRQDYETARARFEQLVKAGLGSPAVLYNLGTTELAANRLGPAVLYLERAARASHDEDIEANLAVARARQGDQVVGAETTEPFMQRLAAAMNVHWVSAAFLATWYLGFALAWVWRRTSGRWWLGLAAGLLVLTGAVLGGGVAIHAYVARTVTEAVVMPETVKVLEFPGERARVSFEVHAGLKVRIMEESGRFARIRLPNALEGWADKEGLVEL